MKTLKNLLRTIFAYVKRGFRAIKRRHIKKAFWMVLLCAGVGLVIATLIVIYFITRVPDISILISRRVSESTKIYDRSGATLLYDVHGEEKRTIVPWDQIPQNVRNATLAAEDSQFYSHSGINFKGILRAFYQDVTRLNLSQGGSTITQQLIKKALLGDQKTISRKVKELILAIQIERAFSKDEIFWMYLNQIPYGSNAYGVEAASQTYFGKHISELTNGEAALVAAVPQAPTFYSPYGNNLDRLMARRNYILGRMKSLGMLSDADYAAAMKEVPTFKPNHDILQAPHFVIAVRDYLVKKYGEDMLQNGGLTVTTTLDSNLQTIAEDVVTKYGDINEKKYKATNAALTAIDPKTGQILAMVGSRDYFNIEKQGNFNVALALRQPGSSFKPFAYATAFAHGFTDSTILYDLRTEFNPQCDPLATQTRSSGGACYHPQNYDGTYVGPITMREALSQSRNVPAVQTLYLAGIPDTIQLAQAMGISTLNDPSRFGLSLVLGGAEVRLVDMVSAYGVFANDGIREPAVSILKVVAADGTVLEEYKPQEEQVIDSQIARLVNDVLSDNNARAPVFGLSNPLYLGGRPVAAKTGTTQDNRDGWLVGFTPGLAAGVWTGNNNNTPMTQAGAGVSAAGPMWNEFMRRALTGTPVHYFIKPNPIVTDKIMLNGDYHGPQGIHTILYYVDPRNPQGSPPNDPTSDPQFANWEFIVRNWVGQTGQQETYIPIGTPPPSPYDDSQYPTPAPIPTY